MEIVLIVFAFLILFCIYCFNIMSRNLTHERVMEERLNSITSDSLFNYDTNDYSIQFYHNEDNSQFELLLVRTQEMASDFNVVYKFNASELRKVELYEDNTCAMSVGRAVVGGALFGTAGAIVGGSSGKNKIDNLTMIIYTKNINKPQITVPIITSRTSKNSSIYIRAIQFARNVMGALEIVIEENKEN